MSLCETAVMKSYLWTKIINALVEKFNYIFETLK